MKKTILAMVIGIFITMRISAFDLWNGLDTDKDLSAVLFEAYAILQLKELSDVSDASPKSFVESIINYDGDMRNRIPQNLTGASLFSPLPQYQRIVLPGVNQGKPMPNIDLYFSNRKLFGISVIYGSSYPTEIGSTSAKLIAEVSGQYGEPKKMTKLVGNVNHTFYVWDKPDRIIYCQGRMMYIINKQLLKK